MKIYLISLVHNFHTKFNGNIPSVVVVIIVVYESGLIIFLLIGCHEHVVIVECTK